MSITLFCCCSIHFLHLCMWTNEMEYYNTIVRLKETAAHRIILENDSTHLWRVSLGETDSRAFDFLICLLRNIYCHRRLKWHIYCHSHQSHSLNKSMWNSWKWGSICCFPFLVTRDFIYFLFLGALPGHLVQHWVWLAADWPQQQAITDTIRMICMPNWALSSLTSGTYYMIVSSPTFSWVLGQCINLSPKPIRIILTVQILSKPAAAAALVWGERWVWESTYNQSNIKGKNTLH